MQTLARLLGVLEYVLVPVSLVWLTLAIRRPSRRRARRSIALAAALAVTVAQPFGITATPRGSPPRGAHPVGPTSVHIARLFGSLPILPFALYREDDLVDFGNGATASLKARSWLWLPILTNATTVTRICSNDVRTPCFGNSGGSAGSLQLSEKDGRYYATVPVPGASSYAGVKPSYTWELGVGVASIAGLIYWLLVAALIPLVLTSTRRLERTASRAAL